MLDRHIIDSETAQLVADALHQWHVGTASAALRAPGHVGSSFDGLLLHQEALTVVVDANVLRNDILYSCRNERRTTLVTAANTGALRLYVAEHVVREVDEDTAEWCAESNCDPIAFRERFKTDYLPRLQVIPHNAIPLTILDPDELRRIDDLASRGSKDVPSTLLSLSLGAPFLSTDEAAWETVYGKYRSYDGLQNWRETLTCGSNASALAKAHFLAIGTPLAGLIGIVQAVRFLASRAPWVLALGVGAAAYAALRAPDTTWVAARGALGKMGTVLYEVQRLYELTLEQFHAAAPPIPSWDSLHGVIDKRALLLRASLRTLAHSAETDVSAQTLADALPELHVAQSTPIVRAILRENAAFSQRTKGKWRVGHTFGYRV